ncbi:S1 family peptidase [Microbulbifer variabilis]|uniref:S1 family peptidase n=1 Tax=Microbulbifer variabilis TaxID=266805 RepID=UPI001CFEC982|nr:trypsin-like serine protease [Microbulbifer variabilis]
MIRFMLLVLFFVSSSVYAIVIRDDVDDSKYRVPGSEYPALADIPGEGHGILIAPQWIITAAHAVTWRPEQIVLNGKSRNIERLIIHSGYKKPSEELLDHALATWEWTLFAVLLSSSDDIALLKLAQPVTDVSPVAIYKGDNEFGQSVKIIGKGATGTGVTGYDFHDSHRTELRRAENKVTSAHGRWFCYVFDAPPEALALEGSEGNGDSGGPIIIQTDDDWLLAGLTSWTAPQGTTRTPPGQYGQISCNVRLSHYKEWIGNMISERSKADR